METPAITPSTVIPRGHDHLRCVSQLRERVIRVEQSRV